MAFERLLVSGSQDDLTDFKVALVLCSDTVVMPGAPALRRNIGSLLCGLLSAYRLMDVLYAIQDPESQHTNPGYPRLSSKGLRPTSSVSRIFLRSVDCSTLRCLSSLGHCKRGYLTSVKRAPRSRPSTHLEVPLLRQPSNPSLHQPMSS